jgi:Uma2 family endonuclease
MSLTSQDKLMVALTQQENPLQMTEAEYLEFERSSTVKHEFRNGEVCAMTGASWEHNMIFGATFASLFTQLRDTSCTVNPSDQRIKVMATGLMTYPDISVVCGEPRFAGGEFDTLINPIAIIEILSKTTEAYDRGEKFQHYREIETLQDYLLISQDKARIEGYSRQTDGKWMLTDAVGLDTTFEIASIDCKLALADVYAKISFPANDPERGANSETETS